MSTYLSSTLTSYVERPDCCVPMKQEPGRKNEEVYCGIIRLFRNVLYRCSIDASRRCCSCGLSCASLLSSADEEDACLNILESVCCCCSKFWALSSLPRSVGVCPFVVCFEVSLADANEGSELSVSCGMSEMWVLFYYYN